jgi:hypothetical protein
MEIAKDLKGEENLRLYAISLEQQLKARDKRVTELEKSKKEESDRWERRFIALENSKKVELDRYDAMMERRITELRESFRASVAPSDERMRAQNHRVRDLERQTNKTISNGLISLFAVRPSHLPSPPPYEP